MVECPWKEGVYQIFISSGEYVQVLFNMFPIHRTSDPKPCVPGWHRKQCSKHVIHPLPDCLLASLSRSRWYDRYIGQQHFDHSSIQKVSSRPISHIKDTHTHTQIHWNTLPHIHTNTHRLTPVHAHLLKWCGRRGGPFFLLLYRYGYVMHAIHTPSFTF